MNIHNALIGVALMLATIGGYVLYWAAWRWGFSHLWPSGPSWLVRPELPSFLASCITGLIITLSILRAS
jgi:hypothetical protein